MGTVEILGVITRPDVAPSRVLQAALDADLESVVIIGHDKSGDEYFASSLADGGDALWLLERSKLKLLTVEVNE